MQINEIIKNNVNPEKLEVINQDGNVLVTANPGTGKTLLLAYKYLYLLDKGYSPKDILCLTFTTKAKSELEERIIAEIKKTDLQVDLSAVNVHTFHSFALEYLDDNNIVSSNLLRYAIFDYLTKNSVLNYVDNYLLDTIVPKFENLLRYLKNYNIRPYDIDLKKVKSLLEDYKKVSKEDLDAFVDHFVEIFSHYEGIKSNHGIDYTDMLLNFLNKNEFPKYKYILVDELQDLNSIEAKIVLNCCENFVVVGDKKQAIFGFQGGSISNYNLFSNSKKFILSENHRSTQEILDYAKEIFISNSLDKTACEELKDLKAKFNGDKPIIYNTSEISTVCELAKEISSKLEGNKQLAIIVRTNGQIQDVAKELKLRDLDFAVTYLSASNNAKIELIDFLKGLFSNDINDIRRALLTPFSPLKLKDALAEKLTLENACKISPEFKKMRDIGNIRDLDKLFDDYILKLAIPYGEEYLFACLSIKKSYNEAIEVLNNLNYNKLFDYLRASNLLSQSIDSKKKIVVTTVHKSKGLQFDSVIYIPHKTNDMNNFQDYVVQTILKSNDIDIKEELLEESLRIDFVALTRAINKLYIFCDKPEPYLNSYGELKEFIVTEKCVRSVMENTKKAFNLFLLNDFDGAKALLENKEFYLIDYITNYFSALDHLSFSRVKEHPFEFFCDNILNIPKSSFALKFGSDIHNLGEAYLLGKKPVVDDSLKKQFDNLKELILEIKKDYPEFVSAEKKFSFSLKELFGIDSNIKFTGKIDAIFKNGNNYLIVDWKSSKAEDSKYKQQLLVYRKALSLMPDVCVSEDKIKVAIGYINLVPTINTGVCNKKLDIKQPQERVMETVSNKVIKIMGWKNNPDLFIKDFISAESKNNLNNSLYLALKDQFEKEQMI